jgi:hypothetical protein
MAEDSDDEDRWQGRKRQQVEFKWSRGHNELEELRRVVTRQGTRLGRLLERVENLEQDNDRLWQDNENLTFRCDEMQGRLDECCRSMRYLCGPGSGDVWAGGGSPGPAYAFRNRQQHDREPATGICFQWKANQTCRFGSECKFSHSDRG